jgi:GNAT superfamily N-acetyltransferase
MTLRHWIKLVEVATPVTAAFIEAAYKELDAALPEGVGVALNDRSIYGFSNDLPNMVEIAHIEAPEDLVGKGYGSKALRLLIDRADQMGVTLVLTVAEAEDEDDWPMTSSDLHAWYERYGFQGDRKMWRLPKGQPDKAGQPKSNT